MKRVLTWLLLGFSGLVVLLVGVGFLLPREVRVERSLVVARPACTLAAVLDGFDPYEQWSPWAELDRATAYTFSGPAHGVGARMSWASKVVGNGTQEVVSVVPCERVDLKIDFDGRPALASFLLKPVEGGATEVTWTLDSDVGMNPVGRYFGTMMDGRIGPLYERGLANLRVYAERLPTTDFAGLVVETVEVPAARVAFATTTSAKDGMAAGIALAGALATIRTAIEPLGLSAAGPTRVSYRSEGPGFVIDVMVPVVGTPLSPLVDGPVKLVPGFTGPALKAVHQGGWETRAQTWAKLEAWQQAMGIAPSGAPAFEEYLSDAATTSAADLQTALYLPVTASVR